MPVLRRQLTTREKAFLIFAMAFAVYLTCLSNQFALDDFALVVENPQIRSWSKVPELLTSDFLAGKHGSEVQSSHYRPVTAITYVLNYSLHDTRPFGYYLINVILHALNSVLAFLLARRMFDKPSHGPLLIALLYATHPIHTEAVANVSGRSELLCTFFYLAALRLHAKSRSTTRPVLAVSGVLGLLLLALGSKEFAVTFIAAVIFFDLLFQREQSWRDVLRTQWPRYVAYMVLIALFWVGRLAIVPIKIDIYPLNNYLVMLEPIWRFINAFYILMMKYPYLLIFPYHLSPRYSYNAFPLIESWADPRIYFTFLITIFVIAVFIWSWRKSPVICFGIGFFMIAISPVANILTLSVGIMGERWLYLPSFGFCVILGYGLALLLARASWQKVGAVLILLILVGYSTRTLDRNLDWHDTSDFLPKHWKWFQTPPS